MVLDTDRALPEGFDGPRACNPYELAPTLDLINQVFRTQPISGPPRAPSMGWDYSHIYTRENLENVRIICRNGRPVASIGVVPSSVRTPRGTLLVGGINAVATHPHYRRLGLATTLLQDVHTTMRAQGLNVGLLSTGITNYYRKLGWERAGQQRTFTFDRRNISYLPITHNPGIDVTEDWQRHVSALAALHDADYGARRTLELFTLLALRKADRFFIALRGGEPVAYVALTGRAAREYAGSTEDVAALLRHAFDAIEDLPAETTDRSGTRATQFEMTVHTPAATPHPETGLPALLLELGIPNSLGYQGMLALLDPPRVFEALDIEARIEPSGDLWRLHAGGRTLDLTEGELVKAVFGPERRPDLPAETFPVPFFQWPMDHV